MPGPKLKLEWTHSTSTTKPAPATTYHAMSSGGKKAWLGSPDLLVNPWRLDPLNLRQELADFYLLMHLDIFGAAPDGAYQAKLQYLHTQFAHYTDMAVGGELRHGRHRPTVMEQTPKPLREALCTGLLDTSSRSEAWRRWHYLRQRYGVVALRWAIKAFRAPGWQGGYGGPKWANIADALHRYETGVYSPTTFVDTAWGLEHNGGQYMNKAWYTVGLKELLDYNLHGQMDKLLPAASPSVQAAWAAFQAKNGDAIA